MNNLKSITNFKMILLSWKMASKYRYVIDYGAISIGTQARLYDIMEEGQMPAINWTSLEEVTYSKC